jgi:hypothetical protein
MGSKHVKPGHKSSTSISPTDNGHHHNKMVTTSPTKNTNNHTTNNNNFTNGSTSATRKMATLQSDRPNLAVRLSEDGSDDVFHVTPNSFNDKHHLNTSIGTY